MPAINVNPTRQELTRLKGRLKTSIRGHKLLKDKRDELMKQFMDVVRENRALRAKVEAALIRAHGSFTVASAVMSSEMLEQSLLYPKQSVELDMTFQNVVKTTVFLTDLSDFAPMNALYAELFPSNPPARSCVQVAKLPAGAKIEMEVVAIK